MTTLGGAMTGDIEQWLEAHDLIKYRDPFAANEIAFGDLSELTEDELKEMGLPIGPRRRALSSIAQPSHTAGASTAFTRKARHLLQAGRDNKQSSLGR